MSDLNFSSTELYQFSNRSGAIEIPGIADQEGGSLSGGISGSEVAESAYRNLQTSAEYYLDRAGRGLAAYQQLTAEIADTFVGRTGSTPNGCRMPGGRSTSRSGATTAPTRRPRSARRPPALFSTCCSRRAGEPA